jgi:hypothetical protein
MLANVAAATTALSWLALVPATGWTAVETINYTALAFAAVALVVGLIARIWHAARADLARWGGLGIAGVAISGLAAQTVAGRPALERPWIAVALVVVAVSAELSWRSFDPVLRYLTVTGVGLSWLALLPSTGWEVRTGAAITVLLFGGLLLVVVEWSRRLLRPDSPAPLGLVQAWALLGALFVFGAAVVAETTEGWPDASFWVAGCVGLLAVGAARAAVPFGIPGLRETSSVVGVAALTRLAVAAEPPDALFAAGFLVVAAIATSAALVLWRRSAQSVWIRPIFVVSGLANLVALVGALGTLPERGFVVAVVLTLGAQAIAVGLIRGLPGMLAAGPPLIGFGFILAIAGNVSGTAQWYTIPIAVVLLSEVEILRWQRRSDDGATARQDVLVLEWAALGLLAGPPLVEMFTRGLAHGWTAVGIAIGVMVWGDRHPGAATVRGCGVADNHHIGVDGRRCHHGKGSKLGLLLDPRCRCRVRFDDGGGVRRGLSLPEGTSHGSSRSVDGGLGMRQPYMTMFATAGMVTSFWGLVATAAIVDIEAADASFIRV